MRWFSYLSEGLFHGYILTCVGIGTYMTIKDYKSGLTWFGIAVMMLATRWWVARRERRMRLPSGRYGGRVIATKRIKVPSGKDVLYVIYALREEDLNTDLQQRHNE